MKRIEIGMFAATLVIAGVALAGDVECWANETFSPDGKNVIRLYANPLAYEVVREGVTVVAKSEIGLTVDSARLDGTDATERVPPVVKRGTRICAVRVQGGRDRPFEDDALPAVCVRGEREVRVRHGVRRAQLSDLVFWFAYGIGVRGEVRGRAEARQETGRGDQGAGARNLARGNGGNADVPVARVHPCGCAGTPDTMFVAARETRDGAWYAGGITIAEARDCTLDTSFLGAGEWTIEIFRYAGDAKEDAQRYVHETRKVKAVASSRRRRVRQRRRHVRSGIQGNHLPLQDQAFHAREEAFQVPRGRCGVERLRLWMAGDRNLPQA